MKIRHVVLRTQLTTAGAIIAAVMMSCLFVSVQTVEAKQPVVEDVSVEERTRSINNGTCGENLIWEYDGKGHLTIEGYGAMEEWDYESDVPWNAFRSDITEISLPNGLTTISNHAFSGNCAEEIILPDGITSIGYSAFSYSSRLSHVVIPASVDTMSDGVFFETPCLRSVGPLNSGCDIEYGWTETIPDCAFMRANYIQSIAIKSGITEIGDYAFINIDRIEELFIPDGVTTVGSSAFGSATGLKHVVVPKSLCDIGLQWLVSSSIKTAGPVGGGYDFEFGWDEEIPAYALEYFDGLNYVRIPQGVTAIGSFNLGGKNNLRTAGPIGGGYDIEFGWKTAIPEYAFYDLTRGIPNLEEIYLPDTIETIGRYAFANNPSLKKLKMPKKLKTLGAYAFEECDSLEQVEIPSGTIGDLAFFGCDKLKKLSMGDGVDSIKDRAFSNTGLTEITFGSNTKFIDREAFSHTGISELVLPSGLEEIGSSAFYGCDSLKKVVLPEKLGRVGTGAFPGTIELAEIYTENLGSIENATFLAGYSGGKNLKELYFGDGVTEIPGGMFARCRNLQAIRFGNSISKIGASSFSDCTQLDKLVLPHSVTDIGENAFTGCASLKEVSFGDNITEIPYGAFSACSALQTVHFGNSISKIDAHAFDRCTQLNNITISVYVTDIGEGAFSECTGITDVYYDGTEEEWSNISIGSLNECLEEAEIHFSRSERLRITGFVNSSLRYTSGTHDGQDYFNILTSNSMIFLGLHVTEGASYDMYADSACTKKLDSTLFALNKGTNTYYVLITKGDESTVSIIYVYRTDPSLFESRLVTKRIYYYSPYNEDDLYGLNSTNYSGNYNDLKGYYEDVKWGSRLFINSSTNYNKDLALLAGTLCAAAEGRDSAAGQSADGNDGDFIAQAYRALEYDDFYLYSYPGSRENRDECDFARDDHLAFSVGSKEFDDYVLLTVVVRGTKTIFGEAWNDRFTGSGNENKKVNGYQAYEYVYDFYTDIIHGMDYYVEDHPAILGKKKLKVFVTGHSLGGAAANLVAAEITLNGYYDVAQKDVYAYTFGGLNSIDTSGLVGLNYENIHNIYNLYDTFGPQKYGNPYYVGIDDLFYYLRKRIGTIYGKFGNLKLFGHKFVEPEEDNLEKCYNHIMQGYLVAVKEDWVTGYNSRHKIDCPVDVTVTHDGEIVAKIVNDVVDDNLTTIPAYVEGEAKNLFIPDDGDYNISIVATGDGTMTYTITSNDGSPENEKCFENVALITGKTFSSNMDAYLSDNIPDVSLLVMDEDGYVVKQVEEDGREVSVYGDILPEDIPADRLIPDGIWAAGGDALYYTGSQIKPELRVYYGTQLLREKVDYSVQYSNNINVYTYSEKDPGYDEKKAPKITVIGKGNFAGKDVKTFRILCKNLEDEDVIVSEIASANENNRNQTPVPVVSHQKIRLVNKRHFNIAYYKNASCTGIPVIPKEAGTYYVRITGIGNYTGNRVVEFVIASQQQVPVSKLSITRIPDQLFDDGREITPVPVVKDGRTDLVVNDDFYLQYADNKDIGTASIILSGNPEKGYVGTRTVTFKIIGTSIKRLKLTGFVASMPFCGSKIEQNVTLSHTIVRGQPDKVLRIKPKDEYDVLEDVEKLNWDATIEYANNRDIGTATMTITGVNGYFEKIVKTYRITGASITTARVNGFIAAFGYDGTPKTQDAVTLTYKKGNEAPIDLNGIQKADYDALDDGEKSTYDYTVTYEKNTNAGNATMIVTGVNNWNGMIKKTFRITAFDISQNAGNKISIELEEEAYPYAKAGTKPKPVVKFGETVLKEGVDYTLSYVNHMVINDAGGARKPTVRVTGKGNFTKTNANTSFQIVASDMASAGLGIVTGNVIYSKRAGNWKTSVSVVEPDGRKLTLNRDYTVTYSYDEEGNESVGDKDIVSCGKDIYVHVKAKDNSCYKGGLEGAYHIYRYDIGKLTAIVEPKTYTGKAITLKEKDIKWSYQRKDLNNVTIEIDRSSYKNNVNKGRATVIVKGTGDCCGNKTITYNIGARNLLWWFKELLR